MDVEDTLQDISGRDAELRVPGGNKHRCTGSSTGEERSSGTGAAPSEAWEADGMWLVGLKSLTHLNRLSAFYNVLLIINIYLFFHPFFKYSFVDSTR